VTGQTGPSVLARSGCAGIISPGKLCGLVGCHVSGLYCVSEISMNQTKCPQRDWRVDLSNATASEIPNPPDEANEQATGQPPKTRGFASWCNCVLRWTTQAATGFMAGVVPGARVARDELLIHTMARTLDRCERPEQVRKALIESIAELTGSSEIQWVAEANQHPLGSGLALREGQEGAATSIQSQHDAPEYTELVVRAGCKSKGYIRVFSSPGHPLGWSEATLLRLATLCSQAASAIDRLELQSSRDEEERLNQYPGFKFPDEKGFDFGAETTSHAMRTLPTLQDATFLNAVLPFVMSQARRYKEPLSLMCVAVDRLNGIRDLLGREQADRAVREVGLRIAGAIRSSDVVARIDDDRIIVVVPRAGIHDAWRLGNNLCRAIEHSQSLLPELPLLTVSIGVAEYPSCAGSVYALLDSADHALSVAQAQGRNRAVAANQIGEPISQTLAQCAG
jgi:diguanylate cyclase (GGDEF)-like protein